MKIIIKENNMRMFDPPHPGEILRKLCLEPLGLTGTEAAKLAQHSHHHYGRRPTAPYSSPRLFAHGS
jgi:hypothetical protein